MYYLHSVESPMLLLKRFSSGCVHSYARIIMVFSTIIFLEFPPNSVPKEVCFWKSYRHIYLLSLRRPFLVAQMIKHLPAMQETPVWSQGQEDLLEKGMATHSGILAWRIPWTEEHGLQSVGLQRDRHDWMTNTFNPWKILAFCPADESWVEEWSLASFLLSSWKEISAEWRRSPVFLCSESSTEEM